DISRQVEFVVNGELVKVSPEEVKDNLTASLKRETRMTMGIDGGMVLLGQRTSKMTVRQMTELIELAHAFGTERGVEWSLTSLGRSVSVSGTQRSRTPACAASERRRYTRVSR